MTDTSRPADPTPRPPKIGDARRLMRCVATKPRLDPTQPPKQCARTAKYGEWCRQHAESLGGWRLCPPDPENYRGLASSFWVHYRCGFVACRIVEPHEHGGGEPMQALR